MPKMYRLQEFLEVIPLSRSGAYREMAAGRLEYVQYGRTRFITAEAADRFAQLIAAESRATGRDS